MAKTTKTYPPLHKLMSHTRQVKIHRALWLNPSFLGDVHPVPVEEMLKFLWCSLKMFSSTDDVSTCVLILKTISYACFLDVLQNAGCVNSTQTWLFNISSYILSKSNEIKRLNKTKQLSLSDRKHIWAWFPRDIAVSEVSGAFSRLQIQLTWSVFPVSSPQNPESRMGNTATAENCQKRAVRIRSSVQRVRNWSLVIEILRALSLWHCASLRLSAESCAAAACGCNSIKDGRSYRITVSTSARLSSLWLKTSH